MIRRLLEQIRATEIRSMVGAESHNRGSRGLSLARRALDHPGDSHPLDYITHEASCAGIFETRERKPQVLGPRGNRGRLSSTRMGRPRQFLGNHPRTSLCEVSLPADGKRQPIRWDSVTGNSELLYWCINAAGVDSRGRPVQACNQFKQKAQAAPSLLLSRASAPETPRKASGPATVCARWHRRS